MAKKNLEPYYSRVKEMYENGVPVAEISRELNLWKEAVYKIIAILGIPHRRPVKKEPEIFVYVKKPVKLEKVVINGKIYTDITPIFAPK